MKPITSRGIILSAALLLASPLASATDMDLMFDGTSDGGWALINQPDHGPIPTSDVHSTGLPGITFDDTVTGFDYFHAPTSITSMDLTGLKLHFNFFIEDLSANSILTDDEIRPDLMVNGTPITLDVIDESQLGRLQAVTIDFSDPAFAGIDLANISSLDIRAEYWRVGSEGVESHLVAVPEMASIGLAALSLCGLALHRRRN